MSRRLRTIMERRRHLYTCACYPQPRAHVLQVPSVSRFDYLSAEVVGWIQKLDRVNYAHILMVQQQDKGCTI
ncbi:hypothetical protein ARMGADRAFT_313000 [Armillaria gallica]|uniref:Uncharacterized protein n=1 Tax=Armillaria gallica TaxID=47427 RepID=A0A2H3D4W3_ARMGA|nr:hypothetical protein ARMGADRAFT_312968 [Armillaria gallica]PBK90304.1 hypothetical protein ARMGADRAFT_313000 [Armillaria gallica]